MAWPQASMELKEVLLKSLADLPYEERFMFGCPAFFTHGNMFTGVWGDSATLRLKPEDRQALLRDHPRVKPFEPMAGRVMREYVVIPADMVADRAWFAGWLARSHAWASTLTPKQKKKKKK